MSDFSGQFWNQNLLAPIGTASLLYENTAKMRMEALYYSMIQPFYHAKNIPQSDSSRGVIATKDPNEIGSISPLSSGYFMYSYSLNIGSIDPSGSTNYGKLSNATLSLTPTKQFVNGKANG